VLFDEVGFGQLCASELLRQLAKMWAQGKYPAELGLHGKPLPDYQSQQLDL